MDDLQETTKLWRRGQSSYATTIPKVFLRVRGVDPEGEVELTWTMDPETGDITVDFQEVADE